MAGLDNFIGWDMEKKLAWLTGLQEARLTGQKTRVQTAHGVYTEYNINQTNINQVLRELEDSIASDPSFNPNDPVQMACAMNQRPGQTIPIYTSKFNPWMEP
jgi:hypothetical protein